MTDEVQLCKGCGTMKHVNAKGYCGRCTPTDPWMETMDEIIDLAITAGELAESEVSKEVRNSQLAGAVAALKALALCEAIKILGQDTDNTTEYVSTFRRAKIQAFKDHYEEKKS